MSRRSKLYRRFLIKYLPPALTRLYIIISSDETIDTDESMDNADDEHSVIPFKSPANTICCGQSQSGKTTFIKEILKSNDKIFEKIPVDILYVYSVWQPIYDLMKLDNPSMEFHQGLPTKQELYAWSDPVSQHRLLILDDVIQTAANNPDILHLFQVDTHHRNVSTWLVMQSCFPRGKHMREISTNSHYLCLFPSKRDKLGVQTLARQIMPTKSKYFLDAYDKATAVPFRCLVCDVHPRSRDDYVLRTNILPHQEEIIFTPTE